MNNLKELIANYEKSQLGISEEISQPAITFSTLYASLNATQNAIIFGALVDFCYKGMQVATTPKALAKRCLYSALAQRVIIDLTIDREQREYIYELMFKELSECYAKSSSSERVIETIGYGILRILSEVDARLQRELHHLKREFRPVSKNIEYYYENH